MNDEQRAEQIDEQEWAQDIVSEETLERTRRQLDGVLIQQAAHDLLSCISITNYSWLMTKARKSQRDPSAILNTYIDLWRNIDPDAAIAAMGLKKRSEREVDDARD